MSDPGEDVRPPPRLRVRAFAPYPETGPSTRFRLHQYVGPLAERGVELEILPFVRSEEYAALYEPGGWLAKAGILARGLKRRLRTVRSAGAAEVALVQRELAPSLNGPLLRRLSSAGVPIVYDFDDAVFLPHKGGSRLMGLLRRPRAATRAFCRASARVLAGNAYLAAFARGARGAGDGEGTGTAGAATADAGDADAVRVLPTVIDTDRFSPPDEGAARAGQPPVIGWVGTHTTVGYLESLYPVLERLARRVRFRFLVVSNRPPPPAPGLDLEFRAWSAEEEVALVRALDVGLYPLADDPWTRGKCGFKAIQYLACGVPVVASPVGVLPEIVLDGETGLLASDPAEWSGALERLIREPGLRRELGRRGRERVVARYSVEAAVEELAATLREAAGSRA